MAGIESIVDLDQYKYVWPYHGQHVPIRVGPVLLYVPIPYGFISDGASGVPDLSLHAYFAHDRLYVSPVATTGTGQRVRLTKRQCDEGYGWILAQDGHAARGFLRAKGLHAVIGTKHAANRVWERYRQRELMPRDAEGRPWWARECSRGGLIVDHAASAWHFPTHHLRDAIPV